MEDRNQELLRQYNIKIYNTYRIRGAFILETDKGLKLLKMLDGSKNRVEFENIILKHLTSLNYTYVDMYVTNSLGEIVTEDTQGNKCVLKNWYPGDECNLRDEGDVYEATLNLAKLHSILRKVPLTKEQVEFNGSADLMEVFDKRNRELKRVRGYIRDKRKKNEFEICYLNRYDEFYKQATLATKLLEELDYKEMESVAINNQYVCHGNYTYHNVIKLNQSSNTQSNCKVYQYPEKLSAANIKESGNNIIATTNFDKSYVGIQIMDLYQYMRKVMEKNDWDLDMGSMILDTYENVLQISKNELRLLYILLLYPEKFWKITNFYYNGKKSWVPQRNIQKLIGIGEQIERKDKFLECLLGTLN